MERTIKGIKVIAYKGMEFDMTCRGFKYEVGKTYKTDKAELCNCGFHACLNPRDVLEYYSQNENSRYFKVKLSGEITQCDEFDTQVAATEITILEEINIDEIIETAEWWKNNNVLDLLYYQENFAKVQRANGNWNLINKKGKLLSEQWFNYVYDFSEGFAIVRNKNHGYNFIDKQGKILSNEWFKSIDYFNKDGLAKVQRTNDEWNFIDTKGKILSEQWFMWVDDFHEGFARVKRRNDKWNFIDKKGNYLSDEWFMWAYYFHDGFARVKREDKLQNLINKQGKLLSNEWFYSVEDFQ